MNIMEKAFSQKKTLVRLMATWTNVSIILSIAILCGLQGCTSSGSSIPQTPGSIGSVNISSVIVKNKDFTEPFTLLLPCGNDLAILEKALNSSDPSRLIGLTGYNIEGLNILANNGMVIIKDFNYKINTNPPIMRTNKYLSWTDSIKQYVYEGIPNGSTTFKVRVAHRQFISTTYTNEYRGIKNGVDVKYVGATFNYAIIKDTPFTEEMSKQKEGVLGVGCISYSDINRTHNGELAMYLDPSTGQWIIDKFILHDYD